MLEVRMLQSNDVENIFTFDVAIDSQRRAFRALGEATADQPRRLLLQGPRDSAAFCYAAKLSSTLGAVCKFGGVVPGNIDSGLPSIAALITVLDPDTGRPCAIIEGSCITTRRTAAASAVAVEQVTPRDSTRLAIFGSGVQAAAHARAIMRVLPLEQVTIFNRDRSSARILAASLDEELNAEVSAVRDAKEAVASADVVALCTTSEEPVLELEWLRRGATVVSVGSFARGRCEVSPEIAAIADLILVDDIETALEHAGPIVAAQDQQILDETKLCALGEVVIDAGNVRQNVQDIVYINSVGIGAQDAAAANAVLEVAERKDLGVKFEF